MSQYGVLICSDKKQKFMLGTAVLKVLPDGELKALAFHEGGPAQPLNSEQLVLNKALWKFLADTQGHNLVVKLEHQLNDEEHDYAVIGQEIPPDISYEEYTHGWKG
jgi:hypothetical protein